MLQRNKNFVNRESTVSEFAALVEVLESFAGFVRRQFPVILFVLLLTLAVVAVFLFATPPRYAAQAKLIIDSRKVQLFQQQSVLGEIPVESATVESQIEILKSENIALSVIKDLHLIEDPEFVESTGGVIGTIMGLIPNFFAPPNESKSEPELTRRALGVFQGQLAARRAGQTYVIDIGFVSLDPTRAAQVANAVADAYIVDQLEAKYETTRRAGAWLQDRLQELRGQASTAERAVVDYKTKNNIVDTGGTGGRLINEQQLADLNAALVQARAKTTEDKARLDRIDEIIREEGSGEKLAIAPAVTDVLQNAVITPLRQRYLDYAAREADYSNRYGHNHLAVVNLRNQMREIRKAILDELKRIAETYKSDYEIAKAREDSLQRSLDQIVAESQTTNQAQIVLRQLESAAKSYRSLYDNFLQRYMESVQQQSFPITEARVITRASSPPSPSSPRTLHILAIASFGGAVLGLSIALFRDISDRVFRNGMQVETTLLTNCIAMVPKFDCTKSIVRGRQNLPCATVDMPLSRFTEAIRAIKVAADLSAAGKASKVIGFTSSLPNEGKSTVAANVAQLIAHAGARTILVDGDLRNPWLSEVLARTAKIGSLDVISGKASLDQAVWNDPITNVAFLPAVSRSHLQYSNEILGSDEMKKLFDELRRRYEWVVVDFSPLAPVVDVRSTAHLVDSYVLVIEWGRTKIEAVEHALHSARGVYENLLGVVLNKVDVRQLRKYDRGNFYHNKYYARYGYTE